MLRRMAFNEIQSVMDSTKIEKRFQTRNNERPFACASCSLRFTELNHLNEHMANHMNQRLIACTQCNKKFKTSKTLNLHVMYTHSGEKPFSCTQCSSKFIRSSTFKAHLAKLHGEKQFYCTQCCEGFVGSNQLDMHMSCHVNSPGRCFESGRPKRRLLPFACTWCILKFRTSCSLRVHFKKCHGKKNKNTFSCTQCSKIFFKSSELDVHQRSHTRGFACKLCRKRFTLFSCLKVHMCTQSNNKQFACTNCTMTFTESSDLRSHLAEHNKSVKPFACNICNVNFEELGAFVAHSRTHTVDLETIVLTKTGEESFAYFYSGMRFTHLPTLNVHLHTQNFFACSQCSERCDELAKLKQHFIGVHCRNSRSVSSQMCCPDVNTDNQSSELGELIDGNSLTDNQSSELGELIDGNSRSVSSKMGCPDVNTDNQSSELGEHINGNVVVGPTNCKEEWNDEHKKSVKPFACNICNVNFEELGAFVAHSRTHTVDLETIVLTKTGEESFAYFYSGMRFTHLPTLNVHLHTQNFFACSQCSERCDELAKLKQHFIGVHCRNSRSVSSQMCCPDVNTDNQSSELGELIDGNSRSVSSKMGCPDVNTDKQSSELGELIDGNSRSVSSKMGCPDVNTDNQSSELGELINGNSLTDNQSSELGELIDGNSRSVSSKMGCPDVNTDNQSSELSELINGNVVVGPTNYKEEWNDDDCVQMLLNNYQLTNIAVKHFEHDHTILSRESFEMEVATEELCDTPSSKEVASPSSTVLTLMQGLPGQVNVQKHFKETHPRGNNDTILSGRGVNIKVQTEALSDIAICDLVDSASSYITSLMQEAVNVSGSPENYIQSFSGQSFSGKKQYACSENCVVSANLESHLCTQTGEKPFSCGQCSERFAMPDNLRNHVSYHKQVACNLCSMKFHESVSLQAHLLTHVVEKTFPCPQCSLSFLHQYELAKHLRKHPVEEPCACLICGVIYPREVNIDIHSHANKDFTCTQCTRKETPVNEIQIRTHTDEKSFACPHCSVSFADSTIFKAHLHNHAEEEPYACTLCSTRFTMPLALKIHLATHTEKKSLACPHCNMRFSGSGSLEIHLLTHTGESLTCTYCSMRFTRLLSLKAHLITHIGEKPLAELGNLVRHTVHEESCSTMSADSFERLGENCEIKVESDTQIIVESVGSASSNNMISHVEQTRYVLNMDSEDAVIHVIIPEFGEMSDPENEDRGFCIGEDWKLLAFPFVDLYPLKHPMTSSMQLYG